MANFKTTIITKKGHALMAKLSANVATMKFTKVCSSDFDYSNLNNSELEQVITFKNLKQTVLPDLITVVNTTTVKVSATITNTNLSEGYYLRTIGLFALDPDDGEILYSITPTTEADYMAADNGITKSGISLDLLTTISNSENVSLEVDPNAMISAETFNNVVGNVSDLENGGTNLVDGINKNTARLNDLANPNLLINGGFQVAQRGTTFSTINSKYTLDRWCFNQYATGSVEKVSNGVKLTSTSEYFWMTQYFEEDLKAYLSGKTITCSLMLSTGTKIVLTGVAGSENLTTPWTENVALVFTDTCEYQIRVKDGSVATIVWAKLELGAVATPFIPRLYGEELALCKRYYKKFQDYYQIRMSWYTGSSILFPLSPDISMRVKPTIIGTPKVKSITAEQTGFDITSHYDGNTIIATKENHGLTDCFLELGGVGLDSEIY